jgi:hypothetical protein
VDDGETEEQDDFDDDSSSDGQPNKRKKKAEEREPKRARRTRSGSGVNEMVDLTEKEAEQGGPKTDADEVRTGPID